MNIPTPTIHTQHSAHQHTHATSTTSSTPLLTTHRRTRVQLTLTARMRYRCRYGPRVAYLRDGAQEAKGGVSVPATGNKFITTQVKNRLIFCKLVLSIAMNTTNK